MMVGMVAGYNSRSQLSLSGWATTNNQIAVSNKVIYQLEASFRSDTKRRDLQTFLLRTGAFVQLNSQWSVGVGYCLTDNRKTIRDITGYGAEHQSLEQTRFIHPVYYRSLVATGYRFNRRVDLELSYMLRVIKDAGYGWSHENLLQVTAFSRL